MSAEVVNLRRVRKEQARRARATKAAENRAKFGATRVERDMTALAHERASRLLDGHRLHADDDASR